MKTYYRVSNVESEQGLWYDYQGEFTGLIHTEYDFCTNSKLKMDFDPELIGWLSAVDNLNDLWKWFTKEDMYQLQKHNYFIHAVEAAEEKFYERFQHLVIKQNTATPVRKIIIL